jgi:hypothetical protein
MIRAGGHKLIYVPGEGFELYDLIADPEESRNIFKERPEIAKALIRRLKREMDRDSGSASSKEGNPLNQDEKALRLLREMGYGDG